MTMSAAAAAATSALLSPVTTTKPSQNHILATPQQQLSFSLLKGRSKRQVSIYNGLRIYASVSTAPPADVRSGPQELAASIVSKVSQTDRGVLLARDEHKAVGEIAEELKKYCVDAPVKCPLIFGEWDVVYCSNPTSPGGGYRSAFGRLIFKTTEMIQVLEAPDTVRNKVSFSAFGFLDGQVSLKGKLIALDDKWIQVIFEPPELKVGGLEFRYGGQSEVKLQITYIDEKVRLGKGSRGSLFVFQRRN